MSTPWGQKYSYFSGTIGGTDISANLIGLDVDAGGPGAIGTGTLHLVDPGAALTSSLVPMMEVKVWLPYQFTSAGVGQGVAARGRLLGGFLAARDSWSVSDKQYWDLPVQGYDILLKKLVRDTNQNRQIALTAGHFDDQVTALVQAVQRNLQANVHVAIDTTVAVADLYATMPAVTLPGGHTLGWYLDYLCNTARSLSSALRPAYFMGYQETSGAMDTFGNATLHVYDAALLPAVLYTFADDTSGGEKPILGKFKRHLETTAIAGRGQMIAANGKVATYAETASVPTYECQYINHSVGTGGNSGYWMDEPVDGGTDYPTEVEALPAITRIVQSRAYSRETITFQTHEKVLPGDTIGITWAAQGLSNTKYRVASARITPDGVGKLLYDLTVGKRKLELGEEATDIDGPPVIVDRVPLYPPTALSDPPTQAWGQYDGVVDVTFTWTAADDMRVTGYEAYWTNGDAHGRTAIGGRETAKLTLHLQPGLASTFWMYSTAPGYKGSETTPTVSFTTMARGQITDSTYLADGLITGAHLDTTVTLGAGQKIVASGGVTPAEFNISDQDGTVIGKIFGSGSVGLGNQTVQIVGTGAAKIRVASAGILELVGSPSVNVSSPLGVSGKATLNQGTAFPTDPAPAAGDWFFRTDLGKWGWYDGTRWLGDEETILVQKCVNDTVAPAAYTVSTEFARVQPPRPVSYVVVSYTVWLGVSVNNDGSNYWTIRLGTTSRTWGDNTIHDLTTQGMTAGVYGYKTAVPTVVVKDFSIDSNFAYFVEALKSAGSPGTLSVWNVSIVVRPVLT